MSRTEHHTLVVGGGVIGVCCAYFLAKRGARVTVLERGGVGEGASYGNAGAIAAGHGPINKPGRVKQAIKSVCDPTSPLYIPVQWNPSLFKWLWAFRAHCTDDHVAWSMQTLGPLGHASRGLFDELVDGEGLDCRYRREGYYEIFLTEPGLEAARREAELQKHYGYHPKVLSGSELREREAAVREDIIGGVLFPEAATCDPHRFVLELAARTRRHGGEFRTESEVVELLVQDGRVTGVRMRDGEVVSGERIVLATGAYSLHLLQKLGCPLPLQAGKGYHRDAPLEAGGTPPLRQTCMLGETSVFCTPMGGSVRFAGTLEFSGVNHDMRPARLEQLNKAAKRYLSGVGDIEYRSEWCGLRPCLPDGLPAVGPVPNHPDVILATGHAMLGLTLGPVTGKVVAEYLLDGAPTKDVRALSPGRF
jgi:D-amino-acid dehydrogenase